MGLCEEARLPVQKQLSSAAERWCRTRCGYGNYNMLQNMRTGIEYRLDICYVTSGTLIEIY